MHRLPALLTRGPAPRTKRHRLHVGGRAGPSGKSIVRTEASSARTNKAPCMSCETGRRCDIDALPFPCRFWTPNWRPQLHDPAFARRRTRSTMNRRPASSGLTCMAKQPGMATVSNDNPPLSSLPA